MKAVGAVACSQGEAKLFLTDWATWQSKDGRCLDAVEKSCRALVAYAGCKPVTQDGEMHDIMDTASVITDGEGDGI